MTTQIQTGCPLDCPDACSLVVDVEDGRIARIDGDERNPVTGGFICGKVRRMAAHVYGRERLLTPLARRGPKGAGEFEPIEWDEALDKIAANLLATRERTGGEGILPLCYGGSNGMLTQDTADARLFARLGASVLQRTVCAAPTSAVSSGMYGKMQGVAFEDYVHAELIVVWGMNPSASGIHLVPFIDEAVRRGAKLVVVDPREIPLAKKADVHLPLRPGTDVCAALAIHRFLFEERGADAEFLREHTTGAEELRRRASTWTFDRAAEVCGVEAEDLRRLAELFADTSPAVVRCGWGLERNRNGGSAVASVLALPAVAGKFGVRGGGFTMSNGSAWPLRRGASSEPYPAGPRRINMNRVGRELLEGDAPRIESLFVYNANPLATLPDQERVREGLLREDLFTVVFDQVLTDTALYADIVLPATTFLEHDELHAGYGATPLLRIQPAIEPVGASRSNPDVFGELCRRTGVARAGDVEDADAMAREIVTSHPRGAEVQAELDANGKATPDCERPVQFRDVHPRTADGKVHLVPDALDAEAPEGLYAFRADPGTEQHPLTLISPALGRWISSTFGQLDTNEARLEMSAGDAQARGIEDGAEVVIENELGQVRCLVSVRTDLRNGVVVLPKGLWARHTRSGTTANALCPDTLTDVAGGACFNDARVQVRAYAPRSNDPSAVSSLERVR